MNLEFNWQSLAFLVGCAGILVEWRAYCLACGIAFRRWSAIGALVWACQYFLLDAWTAGLTMGLTALRTLLSSRLDNRFYRYRLAIFFIVLFWVLTIISWQGLISLLPAFAVINTTLALFFLNNRNMRICLLASSLAWLANDFIWQAWTAFLAESVAMGINLVTINRLAKV